MLMLHHHFEVYIVEVMFRIVLSIKVISALLIHSFFAVRASQNQTRIKIYNLNSDEIKIPSSKF